MTKNIEPAPMPKYGIDISDTPMYTITRQENWPMTQEDRKALRRPFTAEAVMFKPLSWKPRHDGSITVATYIDARLTLERAGDIDPCFSCVTRPMAGSDADPLGVHHLAPHRCELTIKGVKREGVGQLASTNKDDKYAKEVESDAIKRAGVAHGIGAYLYAVPEIVLPGTKDGNRLLYYWTFTKGGDVKVGGLTAKGRQYARDFYQKVIDHKNMVERFGEPQNYGDVAIDIDDEPDAEIVSKLTDGQVDVLVFLSQHTGRKINESRVRERSETATDFRNELERALLAVSRHVGANAEEREQLLGALVEPNDMDVPDLFGDWLTMVEARKEQEA